MSFLCVNNKAFIIIGLACEQILFFFLVLFSDFFLSFLFLFCLDDKKFAFALAALN